MSDEDIRELERAVAASGDGATKKRLALAYKRVGDERWKAVVDALANELQGEIATLLMETHRYPEFEPIRVLPFGDKIHGYTVDRPTGTSLSEVLLRSLGAYPAHPPGAP